jgi:hypothetical protein
MSMLGRPLVFDFASDPSAERPSGEALRRRVFEAYVMVEVLVANLAWAEYIGHVDTIAHPLGIARHVSLQPMLDGRVPWLNAAAIAALLGVGFARRWRGAYAMALLLMLFQYGARYSIGEIPHGANLIGMCLLGFAMGPLVFADRQKATRFSFGFIWLSIAIGYSSAAACKLIASGPGWPLGEHLALWIYNKATDAFAKSGHFELSLLQRFFVEQRWAATLLLCAGLCSELGSGLIVFPRARPWVLWAIVGLHLGIGVVLEIWFRSATVCLALLALPPALFCWRPARSPSRMGSAELPRSQHVSH